MYAYDFHNNRILVIENNRVLSQISQRLTMCEISPDQCEYVNKNLFNHCPIADLNLLLKQGRLKSWDGAKKYITTQFFNNCVEAYCTCYRMRNHLLLLSAVVGKPETPFVSTECNSAIDLSKGRVLFLDDLGGEEEVVELEDFYPKCFDCCLVSESGEGHCYAADLVRNIVNPTPDSIQYFLEICNSGDFAFRMGSSIKFCIEEKVVDYHQSLKRNRLRQCS